MTAYASFAVMQSTTSAPVYSLAENDTLFVAPQGVVANTGSGHAVYVSGSFADLDILGTVYSDNASAISIGGGIFVVNVWIGAAGSIIANGGSDADQAAVFSGASQTAVTNYGQLSGEHLGVTIYGLLATVTNYGAISGHQGGVHLSGASSELINYGSIVASSGAYNRPAVYAVANATIINYGSITSHSGVGLELNASGGILTYFENHGTVQARYTSIEAAGGSVYIVNTGTLNGRLDLSIFDDIVDNRDGTIRGTVSLGSGDDTFIADTSNATGIELADGSAGSDTIDYSNGTTAVWVNLQYNGYQAWTSGTGVATNANALTPLARLGSFENVIGTGGSDIVHGSAADNVYGYTGHHGTTIDQFFGYGGSDTFDASSLGDFGAAVWVDLTAVGVDAWTSRTDVATNANANIAIASLDSVENVVGTRNSDRVLGNAEDNTFFYNGNYTADSSDTFPTFGPVDYFDGRAGNDTIDFSRPNNSDSVWVSLATSGIEAWTSGGRQSTDANASIRIVDLVSVENVVGSGWSDTIRGSAADNRLDGNGIQSSYPFADLMLGLGGNDTFVYRYGYLATTIGDFVAGGAIDRIELSGFLTNFDTFFEVQQAATQVGADTVIDFGAGDVLTLTNVNANNLTAADFVFV